MADALDQLRDACARVVGAGSRGTGYVVAPGHIVTCHHVVENWDPGSRYEVYLGQEQRKHEARLLKSNPKVDVAVVAFDGADAVKPLRLATSFARKDAFLGYGFPKLAKETGVAIEGVIQIPKAKDEEGRPAVQLFSHQVAAGQASPLHGFSGSPIAVDGAVVGHLTRHLGDPDDRKRGAYGIVYACPVEETRKLLDELGISTASETITSPAPEVRPLSDAAPALPEGEYHVFVSYRSKDRDSAKILVDRMEGIGLKVFYDQTALKAGDYLAGRLQEGLSKSRAAVVLVSHSWLESPWCDQEENVLVKRAVEDKTFRLIPVRLDDCQMPASLDSRVWLDFNGVSLKEAHSWSSEAGGVRRSEAAKTLERLLSSVVGDGAPAPDSPAAKLRSADADAAQEFISRIRVSASINSDRAIAIWEEYLKADLPDEAPTLVAAQALIEVGRPKDALMVLDRRPSVGLRAKQLRALALGKSGRVDEAIEILEVLLAKGNFDPETSGLLAGRYKQQWRVTGHNGDLERSHQIYKEAWQRTEDPFNGINAAATALWLGREADARDEAVLVRKAIEAMPRDELSHWDLATWGEACLLSNRFDEARDHYREAVGAAPGKHQDIAVMRRQARDHLQTLGHPRNELDEVFPVPSVVAFFGHMVDAGNRPEQRFPETKVGDVRRAIRARLDKLGFVLGFSSAARGSDVLFLEEVVRKQGYAEVILPFPEEYFLRTSGGGDWNRRFHELKGKPRVKFCELRKEVPPDDQLPGVFAESNREVQRRTVAYAKLLDEEPVVIAVWDGKPGDGPGGTADAYALWAAEGYKKHIDVIDIANV